LKRKGKAEENLNVEKGVPKANILVIDDDESIRKVLTEILTGEDTMWNQPQQAWKQPKRLKPNCST